MAVLTLGFGLLIDLNANFSLGKIIGFQLIAGFGVGLVFQSPLVALQRQVAIEDIATATATFGFFRNVATALSVTIGGVVFQNAMQDKHYGLKSLLGSAIAAEFTGGSASANVELVSTLALTQRAIVKEAYANSLRYIWIMYTCTAALGLAVSLLIQGSVSTPAHPEPDHRQDVELTAVEDAKPVLV